jgi:hypothetical protein
MAWTLCTSGAAKFKAGVNANDYLTSGAGALDTVEAAGLDKWSEEAEGRICAETLKDWVTDYANLGTQEKNALSDVCSSLVAKQIISYDQRGYIVGEAQTTLNVQDDVFREGMRVLEQLKNKDIE